MAALRSEAEGLIEHGFAGVDLRAIGRDNAACLVPRWKAPATARHLRVTPTATHP